MPSFAVINGQDVINVIVANSKELAESVTSFYLFNISVVRIA
jgi:hypothetical protein